MAASFLLFFCCFMLYSFLLCLLESLGHCNHLAGEEGAGYFAFLWFGHVYYSGMFNPLLLASLVGYIVFNVTFALPEHYLH